MHLLLFVCLLMPSSVYLLPLNFHWSPIHHTVTSHSIILPDPPQLLLLIISDFYCIEHKSLIYQCVSGFLHRRLEWGNIEKSQLELGDKLAEADPLYHLFLPKDEMWKEMIRWSYSHEWRNIKNKIDYWWRLSECCQSSRSRSSSFQPKISQMDFL